MLDMVCIRIAQVLGVVVLAAGMAWADDNRTGRRQDDERDRRRWPDHAQAPDESGEWSSGWRDRAEASREFAKDRRDAWREREKGRQEWTRERRKAEEERWREDEKDRREWVREQEKSQREWLKKRDKAEREMWKNGREQRW